MHDVRRGRCRNLFCRNQPIMRRAWQFKSNAISKKYVLSTFWVLPIPHLVVVKHQFRGSSPDDAYGRGNAPGPPGSRNHSPDGALRTRAASAAVQRDRGGRSRLSRRDSPPGRNRARQGTPATRGEAPRRWRLLPLDSPQKPAERIDARSSGGDVFASPVPSKIHTGNIGATATTACYGC